MFAVPTASQGVVSGAKKLCAGGVGMKSIAGKNAEGTTMADLFDVGERGVKPTHGFGRCSGLAGMAGQPGTGPAGETCGSCKHLHLNRLAKTYFKCGLMREHWTGGAGTDVKRKSAACQYWEELLEQRT